jgi:hypothetical protein
MPNAYCLVRDQPHYRRESFHAGLKAAGFKVHASQPTRGEPGDVLVVWNKYGQFEQIAKQFERGGGLVLIAENGYLGQDRDGLQHYALAIDQHNGGGRWPQGDGSRFAALGLEPQPWRTGGQKLVIRGQRGIGSQLMASPPDWHGLAARALRSRTKRPIEIRPHPGSKAVTDKSHEQYLADAHALLIWSSSVGVKSLVMGVPVFYAAPHWICEGAARRGLDALEQPLRDDALRLAALERMAWAQWSVAELATGEPFVRLVELDKGKA